MRQVELAQRDLDLHARIGVVAEHLGDAPDGLRVLRRLRHQLHGDDLPGLRLARLGRRHQDVVRDAPVLRHEEEHAVLGVQAPDDAAVAALEHFDHLADRAAAMVAPAHAHRGAVAVHEAAHLRRRQEHRRPALVGDEEAVPVGMALDAAGDERDALGDEQRAGAVLHRLARAHERGDAGVELVALARPDVEALGELLRRERLARALELAQDLVAVRVARRRSARRLVSLGARRLVPLGARAAPQRGSRASFL